MNPAYFKKYLLPPFFGVIALIVYYQIIIEYHLTMGDFPGAILIVVILVMEAISRIDGPDIPISWLNKIVKYYSGGQTVEKDGFNINDHIDDHSFIVLSSKSKLRFNIFGWITLAAGAGYFFIEKGYYVFLTGLFYIILRIIYYSWLSLKDNRPKIVLKKDGIATPELGFVKWIDVKLIQFRDTSSGESSSTNLDIYLTQKEKWKRPEFTIMIDLLNKSEKDLSRAITELYGVKPGKV